ncbi:unnamed protein product, partial [Protopolystoma xenopodis]
MGLQMDSRVYAFFIQEACHEGNIQEAGTYLKLMTSAGLKPTKPIFESILCGYAKLGLSSQVESTKELMSKLGYWPSSYGYAKLMAAFAEIGEGEQVLDLLNQASDLNMITKPDPDQ